MASIPLAHWWRPSCPPPCPSPRPSMLATCADQDCSEMCICQKFWKHLSKILTKKIVQSLPGTVLQSLSILPPLITQGRCWCWCWCWCWTCPAIQHFPQYPPPFISQGRGDKPGVLALIGPKEGLNHVKPVYCGLGREQSEVKTKIWRYMEVKVGVKVGKVGVKVWGICKWYGYVYDMIRYGIES